MPKGVGLCNTITGELLPVKSFPSCENYCCCDEYVQREGKTYCPHCEEFCTETIEYAMPPSPYEIDGDGWYFRPIRPDENAKETEAKLSGSLGFVSEDRSRLYIRGLEYDPAPAVPFETLGWPNYNDLHGI